jgi:hypothetical protein
MELAEDICLASVLDLSAPCLLLRFAVVAMVFIHQSLRTDHAFDAVHEILKRIN